MHPVKKKIKDSGGVTAVFVVFVFVVVVVVVVVVVFSPP